MATRLANTLTFPSIAPGASLSIAHDLESGGIPVQPDKVFVSSLGTFDVVANDTTVTLTNTGASAATAEVLVEYYHTIERAFGPASVKDLSIKPFIIGGDSDDGAGGTPSFVGPTTGTGDAIGGVAPNMTLTNSAGLFVPSMVGSLITISGATNPVNDGLFLIIGYTSPTEITYTNPFGPTLGVAEPFPGTWSIPPQINIFVRTTGNDVTGNGTLTNPYRTVQRAVLDVPLFTPPNVAYVINSTGLGVEVFPENYTLPPFKSATFDPFNFRSISSFTSGETNLTFLSDPILTTDIPAPEANLAPADYTFSFDAETVHRTLVLTGAPRPGWANNALRGKILSQVGADNPTIIASSTETTLELVGDFFSSGDLAILDRSTTFQTPGGRGFGVGGSSSVQFAGIILENPDAVFDPFLPALTGSDNAAIMISYCDFGYIQLHGSPGSQAEIINCYWHDSGGGDINIPVQVFGGVLVNLQFSPLFGVPQYVRFGRCVIDSCSFLTLAAAHTSAFMPVAYNLIVTSTDIRNCGGAGVWFLGGSNCLLQNVRIANCDIGVLANNPGALVDLKSVFGPKQRLVPATVAGNFAIAGTTVTLTDNAGDFIASMVGQNIIVDGATSAGNEGAFVVTSYISETQIQYENAAGVAEALLAGTTWLSVGPLTSVGVEVQGGGQVRANAIVAITGPTAADGVLVGSLAAQAWGSRAGVGDEITGPVAGDMTIRDDSAPFTGLVAGQQLRIDAFSDDFSGPNSGVFTVVSVGGGGTLLTYTNPAGVAPGFPFPTLWGVLETDPFNAPDFAGAAATGSRASQTP